MKKKPAPLLIQTLKPMTFDELRPVFCDETDQKRWELDDSTAYFDIPQEIQDFLQNVPSFSSGQGYCLESCRHRQRSITSLRAITPVAVTN